MSHSENYEFIKIAIQDAKNMTSNNSSNVEEDVKTKVEEIKESLLNYIENVAQDLTEQEKQELILEISSLNVSKTSQRYIPMSSKKIYDLKTTLSRYKKRIAMATGIVVAGGALCIFTACSDSQNEKGIEIEQQVDMDVDLPDIVGVESINNIDMSDESRIMIERVTNAMNDSLTSGMEIIEDTQEDKDHVKTKTNMTRLFTNYYNVANMDQISDLQWGAMYQDNMISADELSFDYLTLSHLFEYQIISAKSDQVYDFSNLYINEEDGKILNHVASKIARLNETTGDERKQVSKELYDYFTDIFDFALSVEGRVKNYNPAMLNTLVDMFEAYDHLTLNSGYEKGMYVDDELEASINRAISTCMTPEVLESLNLDIDPKLLTFKTFEETVRISILERIEAKNQAAAYAVQNNTLAGNTLSELDSIENIREEIKKNLILSLYKAIPDFQTTLNELYGVNDGPFIHPNDSGVSNGEGGNSSKSDMENHGVDPNSPTAEEDYEQAVEEDFIDNNPEITTNTDGEIVDETTLRYWTQQGSNDAISGRAKNPNVPSLYRDAYNAAYDATMKSINEAQENAPSNEEFIEQEGTIIEDEGVIIDEGGYLPDNNQNIPGNSTNDSDTTEEFVPVDGDEEIIDGDEEYEGFTNFSESMEKLRNSYAQLKVCLQELYNENNLDNENYTKTLS